MSRIGAKFSGLEVNGPRGVSGGRRERLQCVRERPGSRYEEAQTAKEAKGDLPRRLGVHSRPMKER